MLSMSALTSRDVGDGGQKRVIVVINLEEPVVLQEQANHTDAG